MDINQINLKAMRKNMLATYGVSQEPISYDQIGKGEENDLEKAKKAVPIGTISNGYKKVAEGKWQKVSEHGMTKKEHERDRDYFNDLAVKQGQKNNKTAQENVYRHHEASKKLDDKEYDDAHVEAAGKKKVKGTGNRPGKISLETIAKKMPKKQLYDAVNTRFGTSLEEGSIEEFEDDEMRSQLTDDDIKAILEDEGYELSKSLEADETTDELQTNEAATTAADMQKGSIEKALDVLGVSDFLEKAGGEGSRGGKVIGHTRSGKPIYADKEAGYEGYSDMSDEDHFDAAKQHFKEHHSRANAMRNFSSAGNHDIKGQSHYDKMSDKMKKEYLDSLKK